MWSGEGRAVSEQREREREEGKGRPDTLASCRGKKWKRRRRREYKEI